MKMKLEHARRVAIYAASKYIFDCNRLNERELINRIEEAAYGLARGGDSKAATPLFVAVADLEAAMSMDFSCRAHK